MTTLTLKIPEEMNGELTKLAHREGVSKSSLVREAVAGLLSRKRKPRTGSFLARAGDLAGCVEGPDDLASNPRHLDGYGR